MQWGLTGCVRYGLRSADMGYHTDRSGGPARPAVRGVPRQKAAVQEATQDRQGRQEGHEGRYGRQGCANVGRTHQGSFFIPKFIYF